MYPRCLSIHTSALVDSQNFLSSRLVFERTLSAAIKTPSSLSTFLSFPTITMTPKAAPTSSSVPCPKRSPSSTFLFYFVLIILYSLYLEYDSPLIPSANTPPTFVVVSVSERFQVCPHQPLSGLQSAEYGCQWLHTIHWDGSLAAGFAVSL
jgi:hypothetical protein